jgi:hypothetical protein
MMRAVVRHWQLLVLALVLLAGSLSAYATSGACSKPYNLDPAKFETDPAAIDAESEAVAGVVTEDWDYALTGGLALAVKTDSGATRWIVVNTHTVWTGPSSSSGYQDPPSDDHPDPARIEGLRITANVKTAKVGLFKKASFAADVVSQW